MCIMYIKEEDKEFPTKATMKICWDDNRDGAGYAWLRPEDNKWIVTKALMTWTAFWDAFSWDRDMYELDSKAVIVHFRVGTTGGVDGGATHPFPGEDYQGITVKSAQYDCDSVIFHNGTVGAGNKEYSDSQLYVMKYAWPLIPHMFENGAYNYDLGGILSEHFKGEICRWVITYKDNIKLFGPWVTDEETGLIWSNKRYKPIPVKTEYGGFGNWAQNKDKAEQNTPGYIKVLNKVIGAGEVIQLNPVMSKLSYFLKDNMFSWDMWASRWSRWCAETKDAEKKVPAHKPDDIAVYHENGTVAYYVKRVETKDISTTSAATTTCVTCGLIQTRAELIHGECCKCGTLLDPEQTVSVEEDKDYACPVCGKGYTTEPQADFEPLVGITDYCQCSSCGAFWGYTFSGDEWIVGHVNAKGEMIPTDKDADNKDMKISNGAW